MYSIVPMMAPTTVASLQRRVDRCVDGRGCLRRCGDGARPARDGRARDAEVHDDRVLARRS